MNQTDDNQPGEPPDDWTEPVGHLRVAELIEITRGEDEAIRQLNRCVAQLSRVQAARTALLQRSPAELRAALMRHLPTSLQLGEPR